jgi:hypothetical protein
VGDLKKIRSFLASFSQRRDGRMTHITHTCISFNIINTSGRRGAFRALTGDWLAHFFLLGVRWYTHRREKHKHILYFWGCRFAHPAGVERGVEFCFSNFLFDTLFDNNNNVHPFLLFDARRFALHACDSSEGHNHRSTQSPKTKRLLWRISPVSVFLAGKLIREIDRRCSAAGFFSLSKSSHKKRKRHFSSGDTPPPRVRSFVRSFVQDGSVSYRGRQEDLVAEEPRRVRHQAPAPHAVRATPRGRHLQGRGGAVALFITFRCCGRAAAAAVASCCIAAADARTRRTLPLPAPPQGTDVRE